MALIKVSQAMGSTPNIIDGGNATAITINSSEEVTFAAKITAVGTSIFTDLDISGDIDVDGTTNLDAVDIDGAVNMATTLLVTGDVDFNGNLDVDGTTNLDVVDIDGAVDMASTLTMSGGGTISAGGANDLILNAGASGTPDMFLQSAGSTKVKIEGSNGNVGIGTAAPAATLHIKAATPTLTIETSANSNDPLITLKSNGAITDEGAQIYYDNSEGTLHLTTTYANAAAAIKFHTATGADRATNNVRMTIDGAGITTFIKSGGGNIRIAETASRYVEIMGYAEGSANGSTMAFSTIQTGTSTSTERMRLNPEGSLLVGTTANDGAIANVIPITAGRFRTLSGAQQAANNSATTMFTLPAGFATYIVNLGFNGVNNAGAYGATAIIHTDGTTTSLTQLVNPSGMTISLSGMNVQGRQTAGATLNISFSVLRM